MSRINAPSHLLHRLLRTRKTWFFFWFFYSSSLNSEDTQTHTTCPSCNSRPIGSAVWFWEQLFSFLFRISQNRFVLCKTRFEKVKRRWPNLGDGFACHRLVILFSQWPSLSLGVISHAHTHTHLDMITVALMAVDSQASLRPLLAWLLLFRHIFAFVTFYVSLKGKCSFVTTKMEDNFPLKSECQLAIGKLCFPFHAHDFCNHFLLLFNTFSLHLSFKFQISKSSSMSWVFSLLLTRKLLLSFFTKTSTALSCFQRNLSTLLDFRCDTFRHSFTFLVNSAAVVFDPKIVSINWANLAQQTLNALSELKSAAGKKSDTLNSRM